MIALIRANLLAFILGLAAIIFASIAVVQSVQLNGFLWIDGARDKLERALIDVNELKAELKSISDEKNRQAETTKQNVEKADKGDRKAREIADKIREAPIVPGKCETPGLELLRNEI